MQVMTRKALALFLLLPLAACGLFVSKETRQFRKSPDYRLGYQDGCSSAGGADADKRHDTGIVRDDEMYRTSKAYRLGWGSGLGACRSSASSGGMPGGSGSMAPVGPGNSGLPLPPR
jgi:hypothetical protein